jgi:hypothetical protein
MQGIPGRMTPACRYEIRLGNNVDDHLATLLAWRFSGEIVAGFGGVSAKPIFYWLKGAISSERGLLVDLPTNLSSHPDAQSNGCCRCRSMLTVHYEMNLYGIANTYPRIMQIHVTMWLGGK